jgi:hypothetical protein
MLSAQQRDHAKTGSAMNTSHCAKDDSPHVNAEQHINE